MKDKKCKRHDWQLSGDHCVNCGHYEEYCAKENCFATRLLDGNGKETARDE